MKHPSNREFFAYWDAKRGDARAPERSDIEPGAVRELLGDIFVLSYDSDAGYPFRVAGTRVCALLGRDLKERHASASRIAAVAVQCPRPRADQLDRAPGSVRTRPDDAARFQADVMALSAPSGETGPADLAQARDRPWLHRL